MNCPACHSVCADDARSCSQCGAPLAAERGDTLDELIREYERELRDRPNDADVHNNLAHALARKGRLPQAIAEWQRVLDLVPGYGPALKAMQTARERLEQMQKEDRE